MIRIRRSKKNPKSTWKETVSFHVLQIIYVEVQGSLQSRQDTLQHHVTRVINATKATDAAEDLWTLGLHPRHMLPMHVQYVLWVFIYCTYRPAADERGRERDPAPLVSPQLRFRHTAGEDTQNVLSRYCRKRYVLYSNNELL